MLVEIKYGRHIQGEVIDFTMQECGGCGIPFFSPTKWLNQKIQSNGSFHCPNGCSRYFVGKTDADLLKEELEKQKLEHKKSEEILTNKLLDEINEKNKIQKQLNRVNKGVCPCCNRTFINLKRHMKTKHSELLKSLARHKTQK